MNKRKLHHYLGELRGLKTWQLIVIALLLSAVTIGLLRHNSVTAVQMFNEVQRADQQGDNVYKELKELQRYVSHHMNTQIERITLEQTYARDYRAAIEDLAQSGGVNQNANYRAAQQACSDLQSSAGYIAYARCVEQRLAQAAPGQNPQLSADLPNAQRYQYSFVSPTWSPDAAGIALLITGVLWLIILFKIILQLLLRALLRQKHA